MTSKSNLNEQDAESDEEMDENDSESIEEFEDQKSHNDYTEKLRSQNLKPNALRNRNKTSSSPKSKPSKDSKKSSGISIQSIFIILGGVAVMIAFFAFIQPFFANSEHGEIDKCLNSLILDKKSDVCEKQKTLCSIVSKGISQLVYNPKKPMMFVLLAHRNDINTAKCLSKAIASFGSCKLNTSGSIILTPEGFSYDTDEIITKFTPMFEKYRSVVFENLIEMDVLALTAMHNFCDSYNPIVKPAIYTIIVISDERIDYDNLQSWTQFVYNMLKKKFENINKDKKKPLITRIIDGPILPVFPSEKIANCHESSDYFEVV